MVDNDNGINNGEERENWNEVISAEAINPHEQY